MRFRRKWHRVIRIVIMLIVRKRFVTTCRLLLLLLKLYSLPRYDIRRKAFDLSKKKYYFRPIQKTKYFEQFSSTIESFCSSKKSSGQFFKTIFCPFSLEFFRPFSFEIFSALPLEIFGQKIQKKSTIVQPILFRISAHSRVAGVKKS